MKGAYGGGTEKRLRSEQEQGEAGERETEALRETEASVAETM